MAASQRIVSLLPSSTEIICALGLEASLVGISHECDYPERITDRPHLTAPKINVHGDSHAIDQEVRALVRDGLSVSRIDMDQLRTLQPDLIVTQDQCEMGAVSYAEGVAVTQQVLGTDVEVLSLHPNLLQDIWADIRSIGKAAGRLSEADVLAQLPGWHDLPAVCQDQVYAVDGHAYFNRPGPRIVDSLEILAGLIHPELFGEFLEEHASAYQRLTL
jgi:ABC-type Fe3+-hydroxamate transport system substrate-binding protein